MAKAPKNSDNENPAARESGHQFEVVLMDISKKMINPPPAMIDAEIEQGLKLITDFFRIDRATIFQRTSERPEGILTHAYARKGIRKVPEGELITGDDFPFMADQHLKGKISCYSRVEDLPAQAQKDKQSLRKWGVKSQLAIPLITGEENYGVLSFVTIEDEIKWPDTFVNRATVIGEIFSNALARKYMDETIQKSFREIKKLKDRLESENIYLKKEINLDHNFENIIGDSPELKQVLLKVTQCAPTDATVIILGETGTGKELIARAIHAKSRRNDSPLIKVDCGSLPATMIERELFGHEKGAFTGAHQQQKGRFEIADGGTLFLDEVGELPLELQSKLLRVLQDGEFERLGDPKTRRIDVRILAATNRDIEDEIKKGNFRSDLWYRLNVFPIHVPPLRDRPGDILKLVNWFVNKHSKKLGKQFTRISEDFLVDLSHRHWEGNVRELENVIQRAVITSTGECLKLSNSTTSAAFQKETQFSEMTLESVERDHIKKILKKTKGIIDGPKGAAIILGLHPSTLRFRMKKLRIKRNPK